VESGASGEPFIHVAGRSRSPRGQGMGARCRRPRTLGVPEPH